MEAPVHHTPQLFAQLGLPSDSESIRIFIAAHRHLAENVGLPEATFWTPAQAAFLREGLQDDADWAAVIDRLNVALHDVG